ncbi:dihydroxyacetone kinase subunit DhaL [Cellulomonas sp. Leaf334]|uniref:dihydroxyacetone kinase subunit DhaL n=1 Tax=Cellulomonas sp. Leaf334 TaxID=1736339 RepID=UPI0007010A02|nr:dihydroxyacetone kinase subunit DhaL [Cellulomonas sp. Leaf334]KQR10338.1 dihydroxyacetone kinase [Cellulomonas sp. Leaf334]
MSDSRVESVVRTITEGCIENEKYFGDLDSVVGDGDFGFSLARGFENVLAQWDAFDRSDTGTFLQKVAVVMTGRIGGTSGPIWGTAFLRAAGQVKGKQDIAGADVVAMLRAAIEGIKARGGADLGEKTLLDALAPMTDTIERELAAGAAPADIAKAAAASARDAAEATRPMQARRGRASYTGERSIGSLDPGAVAVAVLAERVADAW